MPKDKDAALFKKIAHTPMSKRTQLNKDLNALKESAGLGEMLLALYRQQVESGFVLSDPKKKEKASEKTFFDPDTGIIFSLEWNPDREKRKNHQLLIAHGVISPQIDQKKLVHKDKQGKACYLCRENIELQNPGEVLFPMKLAGENFHIGANFAHITDNHFTLMNSQHREQKYRKEILLLANSFVEQTRGMFRAIFNGLAGASIKAHEHLQVTTEAFPLESIKIKAKEVVYERAGLKVSHPGYYLPLWIVEGEDRARGEEAAHEIIQNWQKISTEHTENIITVKKGATFRIFILLRDKRKLSASGKRGALAAYEAGGKIIFSYLPAPGNKKEINERETFERGSLENTKKILGEIAPGEPEISLFGNR